MAELADELADELGTELTALDDELDIELNALGVELMAAVLPPPPPPQLLVTNAASPARAVDVPGIAVVSARSRDASGNGEFLVGVPDEGDTVTTSLLCIGGLRKYVKSMFYIRSSIGRINSPCGIISAQFL